MAARGRFWTRRGEGGRVPGDERRLILLVSSAIMTAITVAVGALFVAQLYRTAFEGQRGRLVEIVESQARLIEAVARFDERFSAEDIAGGSWAATLSQLRDAHARFEGFGETGEFTLARLEGDQIVFLLSHRRELQNPGPVPFRSENAEPMRRALSGDSGTMIGLDYAGVRVLAAYEPLAGLDVGVVAKIDLAEIRAPFIKTIFVSGLGAAGIIFLGVFLLGLRVRPLVLLSEQHAADTVRRRAELEHAIMLRDSAEQRLRGTEELLDRVFRDGPMGMAIVDRAQRYVRVSPALCEMLGYTEQEMLGLTIADITHPDDRDTIDRFSEAMSKGEISPYQVEKRYIGKDREPVWAKMYVSSIPDETGAAPLGLALIEDIGERKQAQEELTAAAASLKVRVAERTRDLDAARLAALNMMEDSERDRRAIRELNVGLKRRVAARTQELEAANAELEAFSYSVSHDLKGPLRGIAGFSSVLQEEHAEQLGEEGRRLLGVVVDNTEMMGRLIDDLLAFSRLGRAELHPLPLDAAEVVRTVFKEVRSEAPERAVELKLGELPAMHGDPRLIHQLFTNLISNAVKFTGPREKAVIEVGSRSKDGETVYHVRDNGVGFDMNYVGKLFGVFQRLHYADEFPGTGVGLAIVRRIVELHDGCVWAEGRLDGGAIFSFTLPTSPGTDDG